VLVALKEAKELDDAGVVDTTHDLNLLEDVCSLWCISIVLCSVSVMGREKEGGGCHRTDPACLAKHLVHVHYEPPSHVGVS
jgi:hypothetical protein